MIAPTLGNRTRRSYNYYIIQIVVLHNITADLIFNTVAHSKFELS